METNGDTLSFSLVQGGPFHRLLGRLGLLGPDMLPTVRVVVVMAAVAWLPLALLVLAQSVLGNRPGWDFFLDWTTYARYLIAIALMLATERHADGRIRLLLVNFRKSDLIATGSRAAFADAVAKADRHSASPVAEALILVLAVAWTTTVASYAISLAGSNWEGAVVDGRLALSWAGVYEVAVSSTLFLFLALRWVWRFAVWAVLLLSISRLDLRLVAHNPDRAAGLGFLALFPSIFTGFAFALGCVVAASILKDLQYETLPANTVWLAIAVWIVTCVVWLVGPLLVFVGPLNAAREKALVELSRFATLHHLSIDDWMNRAVGSEEDQRRALAPDLSLVSTLDTLMQAVRQQGLFPVNGDSVKEVVLAAAIPMLPVVLTLVPFLELVKWLLRKVI
jgi:hypothetical protein